MNLLSTIVFCLSSLDSTVHIDSAGVYLSSGDMMAGRLSHKQACEGTRLRMGRLYLTVATPDRKYFYLLSELFGYRDCHGNSFRFYNGDELRILNMAHIQIYERARVQSKSSNPEVLHYFSKNLDDVPMRLTIGNLKRVFAEDRRFQDLLDHHCRTDDELMDMTGDEYKVLHLYVESRQQ